MIFDFVHVTQLYYQPVFVHYGVSVGSCTKAPLVSLHKDYQSSSWLKFSYKYGHRNQCTAALNQDSGLLVRFLCGATALVTSSS